MQMELKKYILLFCSFFIFCCSFASASDFAPDFDGSVIVNTPITKPELLDFSRIYTQDYIYSDEIFQTLNSTDYIDGSGLGNVLATWATDIEGSGVELGQTISQADIQQFADEILLFYKEMLGVDLDGKIIVSANAKIDASASIDLLRLLAQLYDYFDIVVNDIPTAAADTPTRIYKEEAQSTLNSVASIYDSVQDTLSVFNESSGYLAWDVFADAFVLTEALREVKRSIIGCGGSFYCTHEGHAGRDSRCLEDINGDAPYEPPGLPSGMSNGVIWPGTCVSDIYDYDDLVTYYIDEDGDGYCSLAPRSFDAETFDSPGYDVASDCQGYTLPDAGELVGLVSDSVVSGIDCDDSPATGSSVWAPQCGASAVAAAECGDPVDDGCGGECLGGLTGTYCASGTCINGDCLELCTASDWELTESCPSGCGFSASSLEYSLKTSSVGTCNLGSSGTAGKPSNYSCLATDSCNTPLNSCGLVNICEVGVSIPCMIWDEAQNSCTDDRSCSGDDVVVYDVVEERDVVVDDCSDSCLNGSCCTPSCPSASSITCGQSISPNNNCGSCSGTGTSCSSGSTCTNGSCIANAPSFDCAAADKVHILTAGSSFTTDVLVAHTFNLPDGNEGDSFEVSGDCGSCGYTSRAFCKSDGTWLITYPVRSAVNGSQYQDPGNDSSCESPTGMFIKSTAQWALENPTYACSSSVSSSPSSSGTIPSGSNCALYSDMAPPLGGPRVVSLLRYNEVTWVGTDSYDVYPYDTPEYEAEFAKAKADGYAWCAANCISGSSTFCLDDTSCTIGFPYFTCD